MNGDAAFFALRVEVFVEAAELSSQHLVRAHLTAEQTAGYVDRNLSGDELQTVTDHLSNCEQCALAVDDLDAFRNQIAPSLDLEYHPSPIPPPTEGWWHRAIASLLGPFRTSLVMGFGCGPFVGDDRLVNLADVATDRKFASSFPWVDCANLDISMKSVLLSSE